MAAFSFRLARLLRVRTLQEELARGQWADAEREASGLEHAASCAREEISTAREELRRRQLSGDLAIQTMLCLHDVIERMEQRRAGLHERALTLRGQAERLRRSWEDQRAEMKGIERLEERARKDFRLERQREEIAELDEVARVRAARTETRRIPTHRTTKDRES